MVSKKEDYKESKEPEIDENENEGQLEEEESTSNYEGTILTPSSFNNCPIKTSLGVLGKKMDNADNQRYLRSQN
jgi:hypothetical protein